MENSFWAGGSTEFRKALRREYRAQLAELRRQLACAKETDREQIQNQIEQSETELKFRLKGIDQSLF